MNLQTGHKEFRRISKYLLTLERSIATLYLDVFQIRKISKHMGWCDLGFAETFKALSDPARREILIMLKNGRMSAGEIGRHFDMTGPTISYHLSQLKGAGLVFEEKQKNFIYYELSVSVFEEAMLWLAQFNTKNEGEKTDENEKW